ncbi:hypothetical protein JAAARDRAFT_37278 [Jaapia argillacea MUCL 33604]|uniref:DRBM domain-containing protein n=1 Tax=Jaapia argillacea MUCL 33604 TaxID=933084 RepID=A0A067PLZ3_9AGAM|nr:hypothetical protein JAAARDRAFT_37278 [Jaapia argillacea MUCL 33604]
MAYSDDHYRMRLNNFLQGRGVASTLTWEIHQAGANHAPVWTAIAYLNHIEYGRATSKTQGGAKEEAARLVLFAIAADSGRR